MGRKREIVGITILRCFQQKLGEINLKDIKKKNTTA